MNDFAQKTFEGITYTFEHLSPIQLQVSVKSNEQEIQVPLHITFGGHCFTEEFKTEVHQDHHRYTHRNELRAFSLERFHCSRQLPDVVKSMLTGHVYRSDRSYTYVAQITLPSSTGQQSYSVFFSLEKNDRSTLPALRMFVKSAYLRDLASKSNAQSWRFVVLVGQVSGIYPASDKKKSTAKKKR